MVIDIKFLHDEKRKNIQLMEEILLSLDLHVGLILLGDN